MKNVRERPKVRFGRTFSLCRKLLPLFIVRKIGRISAEPKVRSITIVVSMYSFMLHSISICGNESKIILQGILSTYSPEEWWKYLHDIDNIIFDVRNFDEFVNLQDTTQKQVSSRCKFNWCLINVDVIQSAPLDLMVKILEWQLVFSSPWANHHHHFSTRR